MPSPEQIILMRDKLPCLGRHEKPRNEKVWAVNEQGGHFRVYKKEEWNIFRSDYISCIVSISGAERDRKRIIGDFVNALGQPTHTMENEAKTVIYLKWSTLISPASPARLL